MPPPMMATSYAWLFAMNVSFPHDIVSNIHYVKCKKKLTYKSKKEYVLLVH